MFCGCGGELDSISKINGGTEYVEYVHSFSENLIDESF